MALAPVNIPGSTPLARAARQYLDHLMVERSLSVNTLAAYGRDLGKYLSHLEARGISSPSDVTREDVASFPESLQQMAPASVARSMTSARSFHRFL